MLSCPKLKCDMAAHEAGRCHVNQDAGMQPGSNNVDPAGELEQAIRAKRVSGLGHHCNNCLCHTCAGASPAPVMQLLAVASSQMLPGAAAGPALPEMFSQ